MSKRRNRVKRLFVYALMISLVFTQIAIPAKAATLSNATAWMDKIVKAGKTINNRGTQCVAVFNEYLEAVFGIPSTKNYTGVDYAYQIYDKNPPSGFERIPGAGNYKAGDIIVFNPNISNNGYTITNGAGHVALIYSVNGSTVTLVHQNFNGTTVPYKSTMGDGLKKAVKGVIRPSFSNPNTDPIPALPVYDNIKNGTYVLTNVGSGYAMNYCYGTANKGVWMSKVGDENQNEQHFKFVHVGGGKYRLEITNPEGGVVNCYCSLPVTAGVELTGAKYTNNDTQHFYITPMNDGTFIINSASDPNLVIAAESNAFHSKLVMQSYSSSNQLQRWKFNVNPLSIVTATPMPTFAPVSSPTDVPVVTVTATPKPTATATPKPTATATPKPTATTNPVATVAPQVTANPTAAPTAPASTEPATVTPEVPATDSDKPAVGTEFSVDGNKLKVTSDTTVEFVQASDDSVVKVPSTAELNGKSYIVDSIADKAFMNNKKLTQVIIGKNVTKIGDNAFYGCKKLKSVTGGENVKIIGFGAFMECSKLKSITIGPKVTSIGASAFQGDKKLKTVIVKSKKLKAKKVGANAFKGIAKKATFKIPKSKAKKYQPIFKKVSKGTKITFKKS